MKNNRNKYYKKLSILRIVVNVALIAALFVFIEFALRTFARSENPSAFKPHPTLYWKLSPNLRNYTYRVGDQSCLIDTNSEGFRNEKLDVARNERSFRILCIGDETTFGTGMAQSDVFAKVLQDKIRKRYHFFITEVINAGVEGYTSYQGIRYLRDYCIKYKPDIIVVAFLHNDLSSGVRQDKDRISKNRTAVIAKKNLYKLQSFMILRNFLLGILHKQAEQRKKIKSIQRVSPEDYRKNLEEISRIAKDNGASLIFLNLQEDKTIKEQPIYRRILKKVADKNGFLLDIYSIFKQNPGYYVPGTRLPNKKGHAAIAGRLKDLLNTGGLIPQRPGGLVQKVRERPAPGVGSIPERKPAPEGKPGQGGQSPDGVSPPAQKPPPDNPPPSGERPPREEPERPPGSDNFYF